MATEIGAWYLDRISFSVPGAFCDLLGTLVAEVIIMHFTWGEEVDGLKTHTNLQ